MNFIGNILWLVLGGLIVAVYYFLVGLLFCLTVIGIPFGLQLMKIGVFALWPFGSEVVSDSNDGGCLSVLMNVIWILIGGKALSTLKSPAGRMELVAKTQKGATIFVDYAHTPDGLETALTSLKKQTKGKLVVVFGCGGNRDAGNTYL